MAKLIVLALAFTALVAFATAHTTIVTTTIEDEYPSSGSEIVCFHGLKRNRFVECQKYLQQGDMSPFEHSRQQEQGLESCCQELQNVQEDCQCYAVRKVFDDAKSDRERQVGGQLGAQMVQQLKQRVLRLPNKCSLQTEQQCQIRTVFTTTVTEDDTYDNSKTRDSHQCSERIERQRFNQCQRYIAQQSSSPRTLLMRTDRTEQQSEQLQQCCNELKNVNRECQCEAMHEVYRQAKQQQQQQQHHQGRQQRGGHQQQMEQIRQVVQDLRDECNLQVEQCRIPAAMF